MRFNAARGLDHALLGVFLVASGAAAASAAPAFRVIDGPPVPDPRFLTIADDVACVVTDTDTRRATPLPYPEPPVPLDVSRAVVALATTVYRRRC